MMDNLVFLRFSKSTLKTLKCILDISENIATGTKFLWLNEFEKYRNKLVFYEEIFEAEIYGFYQLTKSNNEIYDEMVQWQ